LVTVVLQPVNSVDRRALSAVKGAIASVFPVPVRAFINPWVAPLPLSTFDFSRRQYVAELVNEHLFRLFEGVVAPGRRLVVGIVEGSGYAAGTNFVFGLASPGLGVASVYTRVLRVGASEGLFLERLSKVVVHEIGHLLGLGHCSNYCVMRFSNSLAELDEKPLSFCPACRARLEQSYVNDES